MSGSRVRAVAVAVVAVLLLTSAAAAAFGPAQHGGPAADAAGPTAQTVPANATGLDSCTVIDEPGHYVLTEDVENSEAAVCIDIQSSDVHFDGNGHLIEGNLSREDINESILGPPPRTRVGVGANIRTTDRLSNVTVGNYETAGWYHGTLQENVSDGSVTNVVAHDNGGGIIYENSSGVAVTGSNSSNNLILGIISDSRANATTASNRIVNNTATGNNAFGVGVFLSNNSTVADNTVTNNGFVGMLAFATSNATVANNTASNNGLGGIIMEGLPEFENATENVSEPNLPNIYTSKNNYVENNDVTANGYVGIALVGVNDSTFVGNNVSNTAAAPVPAPVPSAGISVGYATGNTFANTTAVNQGNLAFAAVGNSTNFVANMTTDSANVWFRSTDASVGAADSVPDAPAGLTGIDQAVTAVGNGTNASLDLAVTYDDADVTGVDESTLSLYRYDDDWSEVPDSGVDTDANYVYGNLTTLADNESTTLAPLGEPDGTNVTNYQVDFVAGEPIENLSADRLYAGEDRLFRFAFGNTDEGITDRDSAWANESLRNCVDYGHITEHDNGTASVSFTVADDCSNVTLSLAVHSLPGETFSLDTVDQQELLTATTETYSSGKHTITVELPDEEGSDE